MATIKITSFGGMLPAVDEHLLPDTAAAYAENSFLYSGALRPIPKSKVLHTLVNPAAAYVYRIPKTYLDSDYLYESFWLEFESPNTSVIRAQVFGDEHDRYYFFSDITPPLYNTGARIKNMVGGVWTPLPALLLGVPAPLTPPSVAFSGGVDVTHTRAYAYTYVTRYGEEGPPSTPTVVTYNIDGTYTVTCAAPLATDTYPDGPNRHIEKIRIYRTVTSSSGVATFYFTAELTLPTNVYIDTLTDATVAINDEIASTFWTAPPHLVGAVTMPNGMVAGWTGGTVDHADDIWFCEPYRLHAWPGKYGQTVEYPIVGLGVTGQTLVVCTQGYPTTATGTDPGYISMAMLTIFEPCLSRGSIISTPEGVYYASPSGLMLIGSGTIGNITRPAATKDKWQRLTVLSRLKAARLGTAYYAWGSAQAGVFEPSAFEAATYEQTDLEGAELGILIDPAQANSGIVQLTSDVPIVNVSTDPWSGEVFIIKDGKVYWLDVVDLETSLEVVHWKSKIFQTNQVKNFGALRVYFDPLPGSPVPTPENPGGYGYIEVLADGQQCMNRPLVRSGQMMRVSSGFKADFWQFHFTSTVKIKSIQMANSVKELNAA